MRFPDGNTIMLHCRRAGFVPIALLALSCCSVDQDFGQPATPPLPPSAEAGQDVPTDELLLGPPLLGADLVRSLGGAYDGSRYLVVWHGERGLVATRVETSGEVLDAVPFVLAPRTSLDDFDRDPPHVFARRGGGFRILWNDPPPSGVLRQRTVERDGTLGRATAHGPLVSPVSASLRVPAIVALDDSGDAFRALVEHDESVVITDVGFGTKVSVCGAVVELPGLVSNTATFARAGVRNLVGAVLRTASGFVATIAEISMPGECATAPGLNSYTAVVPSVELLRAPIATTAGPLLRRPLELVAVESGALAVWADVRPISGSGHPTTELRGALIPRAGAPGPASLMRSGASGIQPGIGVSAAAHGDEVTIQLAGLLRDDPSWGIRIDARTMHRSDIADGIKLAARGGPLLSIPGPNDAFLVGTAGGPLPRPEQPTAAPALLTRVAGDVLTPIDWPTSPALRLSIARDEPLEREGVLPGSLASPSRSRVACAGLTCAALWQDHEQFLVGRRATRAVPGVPTTPTTLEEDAVLVDFAVATGPEGSLVAQHRGCAVATQMLGAAASMTETVPIDCTRDYTRVVPRFDVVADARGFFGSLIDDGRIAVFRLHPDGKLAEVRTFPDRSVEFAESYRLVLAAGQVIGLTQRGGSANGITATLRSINPDTLEVAPPAPLELPGPAALVGASDRARLVWLEPDPVRPTFQIRALDVGADGRPRSEPYVLGEETGAGTGLRAASDGDGLVVAFGYQSFEGEATRLVFRRFDREGRPSGSRREIARDLPPFPTSDLSRASFDLAIAPAGANRWFFAYARPVAGMVGVGELVGRYVTEPQASVPPK